MDKLNRNNNFRWYLNRNFRTRQILKYDLKRRIFVRIAKKQAFGWNFELILNDYGRDARLN